MKIEKSELEILQDLLNNQAKDHTVHAAKYIDELFGIEKDVVKAEQTNPEQLDKTLEVSSMFSFEIGIVSDVVNRDLSREIAFLSTHMLEIIKRL